MRLKFINEQADFLSFSNIYYTKENKNLLSDKWKKEQNLF